MLTVFTDTGMIIGVTKQNLDRLPEEPIMFKLHKPMHIETVAIIYGDDKPAIITKLESHGVAVPKAIRDDALADPA